MKPSIKNLSKQEKLKLLDLIEEKSLRDSRKKPRFTPHGEQIPIIKSKKLEKYLFCGNGFGKTALMVNWLHWKATGYCHVTDEYYPVPARIYLVVDDPGKIEQIIIPQYREWHELHEDQLHKDGKPHISRISYKNGSVVHILTHEVNLLKMEGVEMTHLAFDEPPPRHVFIGLYRGGRIKNRPLEVFLVGTPLYQPWMRTDIWRKWINGELPDVECFRGSSEDNPHLAEGYFERFGAFLTKEEKLIRFKGEFGDLSGQALAHLWDERIHKIRNEDWIWERSNPCCISIDPHGSKPHHAVLMGVDRENRWYVIDEFQEKSVPRQFIKNIIITKKWFDDYNIRDIIYDSAGNADMTGGEGYKSFGTVINEELKKNGLGRARGTTFKDKDDEDFINRIQECIHIPKTPDNFGQQIPRLRIREHCLGTESDIREVQWQRDKKNGLNKKKLDIRNSDFLACVKYGLSTNLAATKGKTKVYRLRKGFRGFKNRSPQIKKTVVK